MKAKYPLILFLLGLGTFFVGALIKILHWFYSGFLLSAGLLLMAVGALSLLVKLLSHPRSKTFLNR